MSTNKVIFIGIIVLLFSIRSKAQMGYQFNNSRNETSWFAGFNAGMTFYYGSLAIYNRDPLLKLKKESKAAFGIVVGKSLNRFLSARGYFTYGGLKAENNDLQIAYNAKLNTYGAQLLVQFTTIFGGMNYVPDYSFYGIVGAGMVSVKPEILTIPTDKEPNSVLIDSLNYSTQVSTFGFNLGLGGSYQVFNQVDANIEISYHLTSSEELDLSPGEGKDNFLYLSLGAIYRFGFQGHKNSSSFGRRPR